jgi:CubicO group peptidase (beta-lactamase class C family)
MVGSGWDGSRAAPSLGRRSLLNGFGAVSVAATAGVGMATRSSAAAAGAVARTASGSGEITEAGVHRALRALPGIVARDLRRTTVPGLAVAVVYKGQAVYHKGFGQRQVGRKGPNDVTDDTVFQLASLSKPISSSVVAAALTEGVRFPKVSWDDRVHDLIPGFTLTDPWVGRHVTAADMFAHRSGLPDHAGDLLEDLGYTGDQIIARLDEYPLHPFRDNYDYTNYGLTAAARALAAAAGQRWDVLANRLLFERLGMRHSSYTFADLQSRSNRAALHRKVDGRWVPDLGADNDGQAPAGGASASVNDLAKWLVMLLAQGVYRGARIIDVEQLQTIWRPSNIMKAVPPIGGRSNFYGLGWNVGYEDTGELRVGHSGAFGRGAATAVSLYPSKGLAIAVLTNSAPIGLPEAVYLEFLDIVRYGKSTEDWVAATASVVVAPPTADQTRYSHPPRHPQPARRLASYVGTYANSPYGDLVVSADTHGLSFTVGPRGERFRLHHFSGDEFYFETRGENATGFSGALFDGTPARVTSLTVTAWNADELGTFLRS